MKKKIVIVGLAGLLLYLAVAKAIDIRRHIAERRACQYWVALPEDDAPHYPEAYYRSQCNERSGPPRWNTRDVPRDALETPYSVSSHPDTGDTWRIVFAGDIMAGADVQLGAWAHRNDPGETCGGYGWILSGVADILRDADLAVGNLETPISPSRARSGYPRYNADPSYLEALAQAGFDALMTANNHTLDQGLRGIRETQEELAKRGLLNVGTSRPGEPRQRYVIVDVGEESVLRVALINYTWLVNPIRFEHTLPYLEYLIDGGCINWYDNWPRYGPRKRALKLARDIIFRASLDVDEASFLKNVAENTAAARAAGAEYVILYLHWGRSRHVTPTLYQREVAVKLCARGIDAIVGAGPHLIQPMERIYIKDGAEVTADATGASEHFVAYSLGNMISHAKGASRYGMLLDLQLTRDEGGAYLSRVGTHIVKNARESTQIALASGDTAPLETYRTEIVPMSEFLEVIR